MSSTRSERRIRGSTRSPALRRALSAFVIVSLRYHMTGSTPSTRSLGLIFRMLAICRVRFAMPSRAKASSLTGISTASAAIRAAEDAALKAGGQSTRQ